MTAQRVVLWAVAILMATAALVAGCVNVSVPDGPYVVGQTEETSPSPKDRERVGKMDRTALEDEVLHLTGENDRLRQQVGQCEAKIKELKQEKDRLEDRVENLEEQVEDLRDR